MQKKKLIPFSAPPHQHSQNNSHNSAKKKILYCITKSAWGGAQRYVYDLATHLPKDEFDIAVAAGGSGMLFDKLEKEGIRTIRIPHAGRDVSIIKELKTFWELIKIFFGEKPDIIHLNSSKMGALGSCAAFLSNIFRVSGFQFQANIIFTVHGWGFREARPWWQKKCIYFSSWFSSLFQQKIIVIHTADFRAAQKFIPAKKLALIYNGIESAHYHERGEARKQFSATPFREDTMLIGTIAELTRNKGLSFLIDAMDIVQRRTNTTPLSLSIIGDGEEYKELQNRINVLGLSHRVRLNGFFPDARNLMKGFDIFVLPSLKEGMPYTLMEAMDAGVPVIATRVGGIPDLVTHNRNGILVRAGDARELADAILSLARDKKKQDAFRFCGQERIKTRHQLRDMVRNTKELYSSLL